MERPNLKAARYRKGWTQEEAAEHFGVGRGTISDWERGKCDPYPVHVYRMCETYEKKAAELDLGPAKSSQEVQAKEAERPDMDPQRRQFLELLVGGQAVLLSSLPLQAIPSVTSIPAEEFLPQCASALKICWHTMRGKSLPLVDETLSTYIPSLTTLAFRPSKHQEIAAGLATQAKILQAVLAWHKLNYAGREMHCMEAVECSNLSGDGGLRAAALMYLASTYINCLPHRPEKAVTTFQEALKALGNETSILRSDIYSLLANAYAQCKEEQKAFEAIALAQEYFPAAPEQDPRYLYADISQYELHSDMGRAYLDLAVYYPGREYARKAQEIYTQLAGQQSVAERNTSETIIRQADAARGIGDLDLFVQYLQQGMLMAQALGSKKRSSEAWEVFQRIPESWKSEQKIVILRRDVFGQSLGKG